MTGRVVDREADGRTTEGQAVQRLTSLGLQFHARGGMWTKQDPGEPSTSLPRISIAEDERNYLQTFALGRNVLELGTGLGVSTQCLADTAQYVTTIDPDPWVHEHVWPTLPRSIMKFKGRDQIPPEYLYDLIFIDADHEPVAFQFDVKWSIAHLSPWGMVLIHDAVELADELDDSWYVLPTTFGLAFHF